MAFSKEDIQAANNGPLWELLPASADVQKTSKGWAAKCWLHEDSKASVAIWKFDDGGVYWKCYGCGEKGRTIDGVMGAFGLNFPAAVEKITGKKSDGIKVAAPEDLGKEVTSYDYITADGDLLYQVRRYEPKAFRPWHLDGDEWKMGYGTKERVLYWRGMSAENKDEARVYLVEGEKDVHSLADADSEAATWAGGADAWRDSLAKELVGVKEVVCIPDRDIPGHLAMRKASLALMELGVKTGYVLLPSTHDISDWLEMGLPVSDLESDIVWDAPVPECEG